MEAINRFFYEVFKANKKYAEEKWTEWQSYISENLKADVEKKYPDGFKDFLVEELEIEITNNSPKKNGKK